MPASAGSASARASTSWPFHGCTRPTTATTKRSAGARAPPGPRRGRPIGGLRHEPVAQQQAALRAGTGRRPPGRCPAARRRAAAGGASAATARVRRGRRRSRSRARAPRARAPAAPRDGARRPAPPRCCRAPPRRARSRASAPSTRRSRRTAAPARRRRRGRASARRSTASGCTTTSAPGLLEAAPTSGPCSGSTQTARQRLRVEAAQRWPAAARRRRTGPPTSAAAGRCAARSTPASRSGPGPARRTARRAARAPGRGAAGGPAAPRRRPAAGRDARSRRRRRRPPPARRARQPLGVLQRLPRRARGVVAARHRHHHLGRGRLAPRPTRPCATSRPAARARRAPPASSIICGTQWPPTNTGSSHSSAATGGRVGDLHGVGDGVQALGRPRPPAARPSSGTPAASASRGTSASTSPMRGRVQRDHLGLGGQPLGHRAHVVEGDGAHLAHRLGDDQVRRQLGQRRTRRARRSPRPASVRSRTARVDLRRGQALGDDAAGRCAAATRPRAGSRTRG